MKSNQYDAIIIDGQNGLVAAAYLASGVVNLSKIKH